MNVIGNFTLNLFAALEFVYIFFYEDIVLTGFKGFCKGNFKKTILKYSNLLNNITNIIII